MAAAYAVDLMSGRGVDIMNHRARKLGLETVMGTDLIFVMGSAYKTASYAINSTARDKLYQFCEWPDRDICSPYQQPKAASAEELKDIQGAVADLVVGTTRSTKKLRLGA